MRMAVNAGVPFRVRFHVYPVCPTTERSQFFLRRRFTKQIEEELIDGSAGWITSIDVGKRNIFDGFES